MSSFGCRSFFVALAGSWPRVLSTSMLVSNTAILAIVGFVLAPGSRSTLFRVDALTDQISFVAAGDVQWGDAPLFVRPFDPPICPVGSVRLPTGAVIGGAHYEEANSITASVPDGKAIPPIIIACDDGSYKTTRFVEVRYASRRMASASSRVGRRVTVSDLTGALRSMPGYAPIRGIFPIAGTELRVGGVADADSPASDARILNKGTLTSETSSWPIRSASILVTRDLMPGDIVSFDDPAGGTAGRHRKYGRPAFAGLLVTDEDGLHVVLRSEGEYAFITPANAPDGKPAIIAPTLLTRLEAQAEWGIFVLLAAVALGILASTKSLVGEPEVKERMFHWARSPSLLACLPCGLLALGIGHVDRASAQAARGHGAFRISGPSGVGQGFAILNPAGTPHCLIVTASHVVKPGDVVDLRGIRTAPVNATPQFVRFRALYLDVLAPGLIVLQPDAGADLGECAPMPRLEPSDVRLRDDTIGRLAYAEPSGQQRSLRIVIDDDLAVSSVSGGVIEPGMSGGLITKAGQPLAVATNINNGSGGIVRLDGLLSNARYWAPPPAPPSTSIWKGSAFDPSTLPERYKVVSAKAQALMRNVQPAQRAALQAASEADEAVIRAKAGAPGHGTVIPDQSDRIFQGQINPAGNLGNGYGKLRFTAGERTGDEIRGLFRAKGTEFTIVGAGIQTYGNPLNNGNRVRFEGEFNNRWNGYGVITFLDGDQWMSRWEDGTEKDVVVYQRVSDGARFEITGDNASISGVGVMWNKAGEPVCLCTWNKGQVVKNETQAVLGVKSK